MRQLSLVYLRINIFVLINTFISKFYFELFELDELLVFVSKILNFFTSNLSVKTWLFLIFLLKFI